MPDTKTVAVTGGTGFVGRALIQQLLDAGMSVRVLTRRPDAANLHAVNSIAAWTGDLLDLASLGGFVDGADVVFHLAGEIRDSSQFAAVNVRGTANLIAACQAAGVSRMMYLSSVGVIGANGSARLVGETTPAQPQNAYEISKHAAEMQVLQSNRFDLKVSVVRPSIIYGEGIKSGKDSFLSLARWIRSGRAVMLGKSYVSSYVYVGDVAAASLWIADQCDADGEVYIVNEPMPLTELLNEIATVLGVNSPKVLPEIVGGGIAYTLRMTGRFGSLYNRTVFSRAKLDAAGFRLPYGYCEGLRRTIAWYGQVGLL